LARGSKAVAAAGEATAWASTTDIARLSDALLGADLPSEAALHLHHAGLAYGEDKVAERHLREAEALAPDHAAVLIALYRFYFYKGRLRDALEIAMVCLKKAARENGFKPDWREVRRQDGEFNSYDARLVRFYLFTLKVYAYLQMRLGRLEEGREAVLKLLELDPSDKIGARVLLDVLEALAHGDDD
jgi:tetratricopeptide (TPR) repeat protein